YLRMLAHCEVVIRTPHGDRLRAVMAGKTARVGEGTLVAQDVDEDAVAPFAMKPVDRLVENVIVVHWPMPVASSPVPTGSSTRAIRVRSQLCHRDLCESFAITGARCGQDRSARA